MGPAYSDAQIATRIDQIIDEVNINNKRIKIILFNRITTFPSSFI
jgi:hypothetical protein